MLSAAIFYTFAGANFAASEVAQAETVTIGRDASFCSFLGFPKGPKLLRERLPLTVSPVATRSAIKQIIDRIVDYSGVKASFQVYSGKVVNAAAVLSNHSGAAGHTKRRSIVFHPSFTSYLELKFSSQSEAMPWASIGVFAHEVGHHLAGHTLQSHNQRYFELQADWYSGYILSKMGAKLSAAQRVLRSFWQKNGSVTHPESKSRLAAITDGWRQAECEADSSNCRFVMPDFHEASVIKKTKDEQRVAAAKARKNGGKVAAATKSKQPEKVAPEMMCRLHGEQLFVGQNQNVYWMQHWEERRRPVGRHIKTGARLCPESIRIALANGTGITFCLSGESLWQQGESKDRSVGTCQRCVTENSFCPGQL